MITKHLIKAVARGMGLAVSEESFISQLDSAPYGLICDRPSVNGRKGCAIIFHPHGNDQHLMLVVRHFGICTSHRSKELREKTPSYREWCAQDDRYEFLFERDDLAEAVLLCAERITRRNR